MAYMPLNPWFCRELLGAPLEELLQESAILEEPRDCEPLHRKLKMRNEAD
jgi:hypothetical protein